MNSPHAATSEADGQIDNPSCEVGARPRGHALLIVRASVAALGIVAVVVFAASLPSAYRQLHTVCTTTNCDPQLGPPGILALQRMGLSLDTYSAYFVMVYAGFAAVNGILAMLILRRLPTEPMALFGALFLVLLGVSFPWTISALVASSPSWRVVGGCLTLLSQASTVLFCYVFPDGRFVPRWTVLLVTVWTLAILPSAFFPGSRYSFGHMPSLLNAVLVLGCLGPIPFTQVYRYRRLPDPVRRQQVKWVVFGVTGAFALLIVLSAVLTSPALAEAQRTSPILSAGAQSAYYAVMLLIPISVGMSILRYRLWDIDILINRTLVYGTLSAIVAGLYVLVVGGLGAVLRAEGNLLLSLLGAGFVAVLFAPLRDRLQRGINHLMYGDRDEPYRVLSQLGHRLEAALAPDAVLPTLVETVREALRLPYAAIALGQGAHARVVASTGTLSGEAVRLLLLYQGETVGEFRLGLRAGEDTFGPADRRLLEDLARQAGVAAHAVQLTSDLQHSRQRLVAAREEERRRLRRDLHDGLGPVLASFTLQVGAIRNLLRRDLDAADRLLIELGDEAEAVVGDLRRLVYALRPPALDELGLAGAIRTHASKYGRDGLEVQVDTPERLPALPAAVEVATYAIVQEALANVVRHARASTCLVRIAVEDGALRVEVCDNGVGWSPVRKAGVGLHSMRERAEELGGRCMVQFPTGGGTCVLAEIPLPKPSDEASRAGGGEQTGEIDGVGEPGPRRVEDGSATCARS